MDAAEQKILNNYLGMLEQLTPSMKLSVIERLAESLKSNLSSEFSIDKAFGAWKSEETPEQLINSIRSSRSTNRQIEEL